jgi:four helix bundle protein
MTGSWILEAGSQGMTVQSYRDLDIFQLAMQGAVLIHQTSLKLPHYETYEVGSQVRRSAKSIPANIAEGFGRRRYKNEYIRFLTYALASCDETRVHLDLLHQTGNLKAEEHASLSGFYDQLGRKVNRFLQQVIAQHVEPYRDEASGEFRESGPEYDIGPD